VLDAENWIRDRHPNAANDLLFTAGIRLNKKINLLELEPDDRKNLFISKNIDKDRGGEFRLEFKVTILYLMYIVKKYIQ